MIFGIADNAYNDDSSGDDQLDTRLTALRDEIRALEKEIQVQSAAKHLNDSSAAEKKQKEAADLERQVVSLGKALDHEQRRVSHFMSEITRREGKTPDQPAPDTSEETAASIKAQNEQLQVELDQLHKEIMNEVGDDFDIDALLKKGSTARQRADELQRLQAEYAKRQTQAVDSRVKDVVGHAADRINKELDALLKQRAELEVRIGTLRNSVAKTRIRCDALEEESRALRMMDVLLNEKLAHDRDLLIHLLEIKEKNAPAEIPEEDTPPVTEEFVEQLRSQQNIIRGLSWKLTQCQKDLDKYTVDESFSFLTDQLSQLNQKCQLLLNRLLKREASETQKIEQHIEYDNQT